MYLEFNKLSANAKIWVYHAGRVLDEKEKEAVINAARNFCTHWKAHGKPLNSSMELFYDQFLVLAVDESLNPVSGCSIDESVYFIKELSALLNIDFLQRERLVLFDPASKMPVTLPLKETKERVVKGEIDGGQLMFNNLILNKSALKTNWIIPIKDSWMKNLLPKNITL